MAANNSTAAPAVDTEVIEVSVVDKAQIGTKESVTVVSAAATGFLIAGPFGALTFGGIAATALGVKGLIASGDAATDSE